MKISNQKSTAKAAGGPVRNLVDAERGGFGSRVEMSTRNGAAMVGHLDHLAEGLLEGWVISTRSPTVPLAVQCRVNGQTVASSLANLERLDVQDAGHPTNRCGFSLDLKPFLSALPAGRSINLEILAGHEEMLSFATVPLSEHAECGVYDLPAAGKARRIADLCAGLVREAARQRRLRDLEMPFWTGESVALAPASTEQEAGWGAFFKQTTVPITRRAATANAFRIPAYADHVRYRSRVDREFQLELGPTENLRFLKWYLQSYSGVRAWRRAPLSVDQIGLLNGPTAELGCTVGMALFRDAIRPDASNADLGRRRELAYWWAVEAAPSMSVEDCLVTDWCGDQLRQVDGRWRGMPFPPSVFLELYFSRRVDLHFLDLNIATDRLLVYLYLLLHGLLRPDLLCYLPRDPLKRLLGGAGSSGFDKLIAGVLNLPTSIVSRALLVEETASRMFDLESFCFRTLSADGHRLGSVGIPPVSAKSPVDIQLIGPIRKSSGLGQAARLSARMIQQGEYKYSQFDFGIDNPAPEDGVVGGKDSRLCSSRINLIHLNAESVPLVFAYLPDVFRDAYNIGYFYWELDTPANCHYLALDLLDEIWVSSEYGREVYASATDKPVINVGMCFEEVEKVSRVEARRYVQKLVGAPSDAFVFLAAFDSFSFIQRKNPLGVIRAFRAAFPSEPGVRLVLKTHNREFVGDPQQLRIWRAVQAELEADPRIVVMNDTLPYSELRLMKAGCDCYVSLHRSEGWGFGMIEAMASGVPVVATGYSGNMEFCTQENAWLVEHDLVALNPDDYIFVAPGQRWAEPRFESAVSQFRAVFFQGLERERKARAAQEHVHAMFSEDAVSRRYRARLDHLLGAEGPMIGGRRKRRGSHV